MQVIICDSSEQVGVRAADIVEARVRKGPAVLGLRQQERLFARPSPASA